MWILLAALAQAPLIDQATGAWLTEDKKAVIQLAPCAGDPTQLCGTVTRILAPADPGAVDDHNPDPRLRQRKVLGLTILTGFRLTPSNAACPWQVGKAYDPEAGVTHTDIQLCLTDKDHLVLSKALHFGPFSSDVSRQTWQKLAK
jgi:hypothetical protein